MSPWSLRAPEALISQPLAFVGELVAFCHLGAK
jgi:hypothetical protein